MNIELRQPSFSEAFRAARAREADYYLIITVSENERDLAIKGELYVARTGAPAASFYSYRVGGDRLRSAARSILEQLSSALPFKGELLRRRQAQGLIDKGRADGVKTGNVYQVVRQGRAGLLNEGIGLVYTQEDVVGTLTIENADEEVSAGTLIRNGFFDHIAPGDDIYLAPGDPNRPGAAVIIADPELRVLLRTLR
jgi:hypothetical protein